jgi:hypothetical protein
MGDVIFWIQESDEKSKKSLKLKPSHNPIAKNRNIVISAFLVYLNAVCIVIFMNLTNMLLAFISSITVSCIMAVKTWMK